MTYEDILREHVLAPLLAAGISQELIAAKLGIDPGRLSKLVNNRPEVKPLTVAEIEQLHAFVSTAVDAFVQAKRLTAFPRPGESPPSIDPPPPSSAMVNDVPRAERRRRSRAK